MNPRWPRDTRPACTDRCNAHSQFSHARASGAGTAASLTVTVAESLSSAWDKSGAVCTARPPADTSS
eukprot:12891180-Prorocentrum_lima.AAC.1